MARTRTNIEIDDTYVSAIMDRFGGSTQPSTSTALFRSIERADASA